MSVTTFSVPKLNDKSFENLTPLVMLAEDGNWSSLDNLTENFGQRVLTKPPLVSDEVRQIFQVVNYVTICGLISLFGIFANIANIIVFVRQGFKDSMNISLFGLAIADLACLITMLWTSICYNPLFQNSGIPFVPLDIMYLSGGWPHVCFNRVTSFITAFITLERCLCITQPLKVKTIITPTRTKFIIASIFTVMLVIFSPFYYVNGLKWQFHVSSNRTLLGIVYADNREIVESVTFFIHSVAMSAISLFSVTICTIVLIVKLNRKTKWRQSAAASTKSNQEAVSVKDKKVVKMVAFISTIFIICFFPGTAIFFMMAYDPEFSFSGKLENMFFATWSFAFVLETVNSSVNIFVYFNMSSKFRVTFIQTFCWSAVE